jgi:peptidoglycan/xylan/chitin deacetylase (PgdA/CDA1 family)
MFQEKNIHGNALEKGVLSLTFDDGPGPQTEEVARFLHENGIQATFFVLGKHAEAQPAVLERLVALGHLVGNHLFGHSWLDQISPSETLSQIERTHQLISRVQPNGPFLFRPPWGKWNFWNSTESLPVFLNNQAALHNYVGPISWDIDGRDYWYWPNERTVAECAAEYEQKIENKPHGGIVLMHDNQHDGDNAKYKPLELVTTLVPRLIERGFTFIRTDEIDAIRSQM